MIRFLIVLLTLLLISCGQQSKTAIVLTYTEELDVLNDSLPDYAVNYLDQKYGDSVDITYDSRGNMRLDHIGSGDNGLDYSFFNANKHTVYLKWHGLDTLYFFDSRENEFVLDTMINEKTSEGFRIKCVATNEHLVGKSIQEFQFINDSLNIDPTLYKNFKEFFFSEILLESESLPVKTILESSDIRLTRRLIRVERIVDPKKSLFLPKKGIPLKSY